MAPIRYGTEGDVRIQRRHALVERIGSASVGALLTSLFVTPLEVVKVRLQAQDSLRSPANLDLFHVKSPVECPVCKDIILDNGLMEHRFPRQSIECQHNPVVFRGTFDAFRLIIRHEGVGSLFNGLSATLWMAIPATVLYFASYEDLRDRLNKLSPSSKTTNPLIAGGFARILAATSVAPLELIRTNAQAEARPPSMLVMARNIARKEGIGAFWRGLSPTLWRDVPFSAFYWILVERIRNTELMRKQTSTFLVSVVAGGSSGIVAAILTHPFDVAKTRRQVFDLAKANPPARSTFELLWKIVADGGLRSLYMGLFPRVVKIAPSTAIMLSTYEIGKEFFQKHW